MNEDLEHGPDSTIPKNEKNEYGYEIGLRGKKGKLRGAIDYFEQETLWKSAFLLEELNKNRDDHIFYGENWI